MTDVIAAYHLPGISPRAYQHPADRAATAALRKIPYLDQVVRTLISLGYERALRGSILGTGVRLGQEQLPEVWVLHRQVFYALDLDDVPELYLTQYPLANASTFGSKSPVVVLNSQLLDVLGDDGRRAVLAHEAAHVHSDHVLYGTALSILLRLSMPSAVGVLTGLPLMAIRLALLEWSRAAELTCDRGAAIVTRDPQSVCRALLAISAGTAADRLSLDAFMAQGLDYDSPRQGVERLTRLYSDLNLTHPLPVRRVHALLDWVRTGEYDRIVSGEYIRRGEEPPLREEADAATNHYADRVSDAVKTAGATVTEVGDQLQAWLKKVRPPQD